jgi:signal transduction histidine kinase/ligand-binding sensor domain-containing protein
MVARNAFHLYDERDGMAAFPIEAIAKDSKGYLWCGTQNGIREYNGHAWVTIPLPDGDLNPWVFSLQASADGSLWVGTNGNGLHRYHDGQWSSFTTRTGFPGLAVRALAETRDPGGLPILWIGTVKEGLWRYRNQRMEQIPDPPGHPLGTVQALLAGPGGGVWVGTPTGVFQFRDGTWSTPAPPSGSRQVERVNCLAQNGEDLWVGMESGLARLSRGKWSFYGKEQGLPSPYVTVIRTALDPGGAPQVWVGTDRGLAVVQNERVVQSLGGQAGLPNGIIRSLLITQEPGVPTHVWIGTFAGLVRLDPGEWLSFTTVSGLAERTIFSVLEDADHSFWFGTGWGGVLHLRNGQWTAQETIDGRPIPAVYALCHGEGEAGRKVIYAGGRSTGLAVHDRGRWHLWPHNRDLPDPSIYAILQTRDQAGAPVLWIGTQGGLLRSGPEGTRVYRTGTGLAQDHVSALAQTFDPDGSPVIWVGTRGGGLSRFRHGQWDTFGETQGLRGKWIVSLSVIPDPEGKPWIWAGSQSDGAVRLDPEHPERPWTHVEALTDTPLPTPVVLGAVRDAQARIYLFTLAGVVRLTPAGRDHYRSYTFTSGDGLPSNACTMASSMVDSAGRVWTGTVSGVAFLDPAREPRDIRPKELYFEKSQVLDGDGPLLDGSILFHRQNSVQFEFSLLSYYRESDTRFRVQLEGLDSRPGPWQVEARQQYAALPDGHFTLKVWARDYAGNVSGPITRSFRILQTPWLHPLAFVLYALLAVVAGWQLSRIRLRFLRRRNLTLQAKIQHATASLREREHQLETQAEHLAQANTELRLLDEQKNRFLAMVAHDLRNPLAGMILRAELILQGTRPQELEQDLKRIISEAQAMSDLIGKFLDIASIQAGKLKPNCLAVDLQELAQLRVANFETPAQTKGISLELETPGDGPLVFCDPKFTSQILDNLLSNALKFSPAQTVVRVRVEDAGSTGRFTVTDQGPGLTEDDLRMVFGRFVRLSATPTGGESSTGLGLSIAKHLVDAMGGSIRVQSTPGFGAAFVMDLPKPQES